MATSVISNASVPGQLSRVGYYKPVLLYSREKLKTEKAKLIQSSISNPEIRKSIFNGVTTDGYSFFPTDTMSNEIVNKIKNEIIVELLNLKGTKQELLKQYPEVSAYINSDSVSDNFKALVDSYDTSLKDIINNSVVDDQKVAFLFLSNFSEDPINNKRIQIKIKTF